MCYHILDNFFSFSRFNFWKWNCVYSLYCVWNNVLYWYEFNCYFERSRSKKYPNKKRH